MNSNRRKTRKTWKEKYKRGHSSQRLKSPNISLCWASWACHRLSRHPSMDGNDREIKPRPAPRLSLAPTPMKAGSRNLQFATHTPSLLSRFRCYSLLPTLVCRFMRPALQRWYPTRSVRNERNKFTPSGVPRGLRLVVRVRIRMRCSVAFWRC